MLLAVILLMWIGIAFSQRTIYTQRKALANTMKIIEKQNDALKQSTAVIDHQNHTIETLRHLCGGSEKPSDPLVTGQ
jgi:hypothetical protein